MLMYLQKVLSKNLEFFFDVLKVTDEKSRIRIRIRIHWSEVWISGSGDPYHWIRNTEAE